MDHEIAVVGAGVVGAATALDVARRGASVVLLEAEPEPGLGASGTNSGILHTGFDSAPGELETELILRAGRRRPEVLETLGIPVMHCGALVQPRGEDDPRAVQELERIAAANGVPITHEDGALGVPGEAVTDPVAYTLALVAAAVEHGAELRMHFRVARLVRTGNGLELASESGEHVRCRVVVNCAGLRADEVARLAGDDSFAIYPRKGEFLVFDVDPPECILLPVPDERTKGVLVFPTLDRRVVAGPTAVDIEDKDDWSVRPQAREEIAPKAAVLHPPLGDAEPIFAYAGLRPAGRGFNYLIEASAACEGLVNVAGIRSTGLTASLGIAERVAGLVGRHVPLGEEQPLRRGEAADSEEPWWGRTARRKAAARPFEQDPRPKGA